MQHASMQQYCDMRSPRVACHSVRTAARFNVRIPHLACATLTLSYACTYHLTNAVPQESAGCAEDSAAQYEAAVLEDPDDHVALQSYLDCLLPRSRGPAAGSGSGGRAIVPGVEGLCALMAAARVDENGWHSDAPPQASRAASALALGPVHPEQNPMMSLYSDC